MNDFDNKQICSYKDIDRFGFTCDVCGRKVNGCSIVNGMKFCAKCYQETFGKDNQQNEIQQLKQQLAEKQNTIDEINKDFVQAVHDWKALCAEKDLEIESLKQQLEETNAGYDFTYEQSTETIKELKQNQTQLAIQELEKVKASADKWFESWENSKYEGNIYDKLDVSNAYLQMSCEIDQQIKELKGDKDETQNK